MPNLLWANGLFSIVIFLWKNKWAQIIVKLPLLLKVVMYYKMFINILGQLMKTIIIYFSMITAKTHI